MVQTLWIQASSDNIARRQDSGPPMETSQINQAIADLKQRTTALRGYL